MDSLLRKSLFRKDQTRSYFARAELTETTHMKRIELVNLMLLF